MDDLALERERRLVARGDWAFDPPGGAAAFTGKVTTAAGSIAVGSYLMVHPVVVTGAETEGGAGTFAVDTGTFVPVYLVGPGTPAAGDYLLCRQAGYRWVAEKTGVSGSACTVIIQGCNSLPLPGASVTVKDSGGGTIAAGTTGSDGKFGFTAADGTYNVTLVTNQTRLTGGTVPMTVAGPTTKTIAGNVAAGYVCYCSCLLPVSKTALKIDTPQGHTLTFNWNSVSNYWTVNEAYSITNTCDHPGTAATVTVEWRTGHNSGCPEFAYYGCVVDDPGCGACSDTFTTPKTHSATCAGVVRSGTNCPENGAFSHYGTVSNPITSGNWNIHE